ncbi:DUF3363 domain-containing protein [Xanthobacter oligotrophicus]|uniref:DUF3363 domain-containing protein n=1 Tax=Xanthobacter oligotrophicus TaxID=2607286 RepID=A0ABW6ZQ49_9HYPH
MADRDDSDFRIRAGRPRAKGTRAHPRAQSFLNQVQAAARKAGGTSSHGDGPAEKGRGRFNARGRGARVVAGFPADGRGQDKGGPRFRSRRVVVKARIVKLNPRRGASGMRGTARTAMDAHLRYLERDGVTREGEKGRAYSALEDEADGRAFVERGRDDRHQFRFIVAPEDGVEMGDFKGFTRDLMRQMEQDLDTRLDWIAVDHHNTGHPHTHILVRGVLDDGRILNIAGDYIAQGIRHRAQELVTLELGPQTELDVAQKLRREVGAERLTRLDRMLLAEQEERGIVDLRPDASDSYTVRANRHLLVDRAKRLERYDLAEEVEPARWRLKADAERTLRDLGTRNEIVATMQRALADHGLAEERGTDRYAIHGQTVTEPIVGRVLAKGLAAGDEMGDRMHLVIDAVDGRTHYVEMADATRLDAVGRGHIVALDPVPVKAEPRAADLNIRDLAERSDGIYRPSTHLEAARPEIERIKGDPEAYVRSHVRRLEALRRAGHVERLDADHWKIPADIAERGMAYDARDRAKDFSVRTFSTLNLDHQVSSDGATWLDRELASRERTPLAEAGFGREVSEAMERRRQSLVDQGHAVRLEDGAVRAPRDILARLERAEITRVGREMAAERGLAFVEVKAGEYVSGKLTGSAKLVSGRFAMIDDGMGFQLVPWQPVLEKRINQHITGTMRDDGGIEWGFGRKRGLGL